MTLIETKFTATGIAKWLQKTTGVKTDRALEGLLAYLKMGVEEVHESSQRNGKRAVGTG